MNIMIIGGGKVGYYLVKTLATGKNRIMLVESNGDRCKRISGELYNRHVEVTNGDGTDVEVLRDAGIYGSDVLIAVTGQDQANLVVCQLAKDYFGVKTTISRVNNPKNIRVFEKLGVNSVISSTARIAGIINEELDWTDVNTLFQSKNENVRIRQAAVEHGSPLAGKTLAELSLPKEMIVVTVLKKDHAVIPSGDTRLDVNDTVVIMGKEPDISDVIGNFSPDEAYI